MPQFLYLNALTNQYKTDFEEATINAKKAWESGNIELYRSYLAKADTFYMALLRYRNIVLNRPRWKGQKTYADQILQQLDPAFFKGYFHIKIDK